MKKLHYILFLLLFLPVSLVYGQESRTVVVGDLHGNYDGFVQIIRGVGLVDANLNWVSAQPAVKTKLITLGDVVGKGPKSKEIIDLLIKLNSQSQAAGDQTVSVFGNHEYFLISGDMRFITPEEAEGFRGVHPEQKVLDKVKHDFPYLSEHRQNMLAVFRSKNIYAEWLRSCVLLHADQNLYVHASVSKNYLEYSIEELNAMLLAWIKFYQGIGEEPPSGTAWIVQIHGPLFSVGLALGEIPETQIAQILNKFEAEKIIGGHVAGDEIRSVYDGKVLIIDTRITKGNLSALILEGKQLTKRTSFPALTCAEGFKS